MLQQSVALTFGGGGSKSAWDDRELINAYDAAMDEFHAHHPGPGSWLDKAMAAQTAGVPLAGSSSHDTAWYDATSETLAQSQEPVDRPTKRARKSDKDRPERSINPYAATTSQPSQNIQPPQASRDTPNSPQYIPSSPPAADDRPRTATPPASLPDPPTRLPPPPAPMAVPDTTSVTAEDALSYAMTSQYWAGYWMGVSQAMRSLPNRDDTPAPNAPPEPNIIRTTHQYAPRKQLKR